MSQIMTDARYSLQGAKMDVAVLLQIKRKSQPVIPFPVAVWYFILVP